ncbi:DUF4832 domain-containing protein [Moorena sp. SIOASIH]|uniref:DUF4832 domain-containing protein n=1 Tax=Moorena sp. SIOASIH TaxID=2607817 RepID=UPI0026001BFC|nr:DUF4832 domain-containing protein [Moorena sp. SIOASIH]
MVISKIAKYGKLVFLLGIFTTVACHTMTTAQTSNVTTVYQGSDEHFSNPERGFFMPFTPLDNTSNYSLQLSDLQEVRNNQMTLVRKVYVISEFRNKPLSESFLQTLSQDLNTARQAGVKLILRFAYNWVGGGEDSSRDRILSHLDDLQPILASNYDVIAYMEAGFIGYWGEWHSSYYGLDSNNEDRKAILFKLLSVLPSERMVALRYPNHKMAIFDQVNPLTPNEAFNGTNRGRTGATNDCFLASIDDWGTYSDTDRGIIEEEKAFLNLDNRYVVQGGETCNPSSFDDCPNALNELERMRWSALNYKPGDATDIIEDWETQGCLEEIKRRLGYRFRLVKSVIPTRVKPARTFSIQLEIINEGWASPYNPRPLEIILRHRVTRREYHLPIDEDPRMWMPGSTQVINAVTRTPDTIETGTYDVFLNLPDPAPQLYNRPDYSIRLANQNLWEASTGYNSLLTSLVVN